MDRCRYLIVVLSPRVAGSEWVDKEVGYWLEHRAPHQLLIVVAEGQLHWDEATQRFAPIAPTSPLPVLTEPGVMGALGSTKRVDFGGAGIGSDKPAMFTYSGPA